MPERVIDVVTFVARCCTGGRSLTWNLAEKYCEVNGMPLHESHIRSAIPQFAEWSATDKRYAFLAIAETDEVVAKFCEAHRPIPGQWVSLDALVKQVLEWSPLPLNRAAVRLLLERKVRADGRVPAMS
jgi:hypothetical protein